MIEQPDYAFKMKVMSVFTFKKSRVGRNYLHEQANIEAQFEARAGFPNVIEAIDCTHSAIKAPSHDEFVYQQETSSFHQCTDRM